MRLDEPPSSHATRYWPNPMNMTTWWLALALMLLCEGALIGIAPAVWRRIGLGMAATAILIVALLLWLAH